MKRIILTTILFSLMIFCNAQAPSNGEIKESLVDSTQQYQPNFSVDYAQRDSALKMLFFMPDDTLKRHTCVIYIYGGGFKDNNLNAHSTHKYCRMLADRGYVVAAIDYRLGLANHKGGGVLSLIKPLKNSIDMAVEDCYSAVNYLLDRSDEYRIDPTQIVLIGSSAGAITSLQADYELSNRSEISAALPPFFKFAGVVSFAGAIFSVKGTPAYSVNPPAPTLMLHGTADGLVPYGKIKLFRKGFFGSSEIVKVFQKKNFPYMMIHYENRVHDVASYTIKDIELTDWFIKEYVINQRALHIEVTQKDDDYTIPDGFAGLDPDALY